MTTDILNLFKNISLSHPSIRTVSSGASRLDASFYDAESISAQQSLAGCGLRIDKVSEVAEVYCSNIRTRNFVDCENGIALLAGHNLDTDEDGDVKYVSKLFTRRIDQERLQRGDILISSAGTVGYFDFVLANHEGKLASQHIIRIRAKPGGVPAGYLYAYIASPFAMSMVTNQPSGSVIVTLYTENVLGLSVPRLDKSKEQLIHNKIIGSFEGRAESNALLKAARRSAISSNGLAALPTDASIDPDCFEICESTIRSDGAELRLEAHFHNRAARRALRSIERCCAEKKQLKDVTDRTFFCSRFTRTFVESDHGIPYLAGRNIIEIRPRIERFLSSTQTDELESYKLQKGWLVVTCSGTVGRTSMVWRNFESCVATHDLIRIVPNERKIDGGYLFAFLSSEYGYAQINRFRHGSVIDHVTPEQIEHVLLPLPSPQQQGEIGDKVRLAYERRADALLLEDEAQEILMREIRGQTKERSNV